MKTKTTTNPVFRSLTKTRVEQYHANPQMPVQYQTGNKFIDKGTGVLEVNDIVFATFITLVVIVCTGVVNFVITAQNPALGLLLTGIGAIGSLGVILLSFFTRGYTSAAKTITYAIFEGLFLGGASFLFVDYPKLGPDGAGIIFQAVAATIGVFAGMLVAYATGAITVSSNFRKIITGGIFAVLAMAIANLLLGWVTGHHPLTDGGPLAIVFSLVCIVLASLSFLVDFEAATTLMRAKTPKKAAWGVALGLAVTLVWLYLEILRLLSYLRPN